MTTSGTVNLGGLLRAIAGETSTEATLQSSIHAFLLAAGLNLSEDDLRNVTLESPSGLRRRIDIEIGHVCIEVKKQLRRGKALDDAVEQLAGYVSERAESLGQRYVGVLTDGREWHLYYLGPAGLTPASVHRVDLASPDVGALVSWLAGILATEEGVAPTVQAIAARLGADSAGHQLEHADLRALYELHRDDPAVAIKRELWAKLLTTALGTQFHADDHELFVEHTLLVATAEAIAHAVLGFDLLQVDPASLLGGDLFTRRALILGVVEHDFFDWPLDCGEGGRRWVAALARRLAQFEWSATTHDVMKTIYESVISPETRKQLGEYYTPDWLAEAMVERAVGDPLEQRVLDPACGSGTFLFHAVRRYLQAADAAGADNEAALLGVVNAVIGVDLHPVAVTLARVTYLLAIGPDRLQMAGRPPLRVPVYLGDSVQWGQRQDLFASETLNVDTADGFQMFADQLRFPRALLDDADRFDRLVADLADTAADRQPGSPHPAMGPIARRHALVGEELETIADTFTTMCRLHDEGRDHIWGYFVRNLARPAWLARAANRVDVLVGNPPWLAYRFMTPAMQQRFRDMAETRGLWSGGSVATQQDLSDLFVARSIEQYLQPGGRFSFVMPASVLTRGQFRGFRDAVWPTEERSTIRAGFDVSWDLSMVYPYFFPRTSAVVHGHRAVDGEDAQPLGTAVDAWRGSIPDLSAGWSEVQKQLQRDAGVVAPSGQTENTSPYKERFANGATIFPRVLTTVVYDDASPIGTGAGRVAVRSDRGTYEKKPWKELGDLHGVIEEQFVYPLLLGECVLPFCLLQPPMAVLPITRSGQLVDPGDYPGLHDWWMRAAAFWERHRTSSMDLIENLDYRRKLTNQFPIPEHRVVVAHSGMHVAACMVSVPHAVVEHQLDWVTVASPEEGHYLCAVLNSEAVTKAATPFMTSGKGGGRHIGKSLWNVPIPEFAAGDRLHDELSEIGAAAEQVIAGLDLPAMSHGALRRRVRGTLHESGLAAVLDERVQLLLAAVGNSTSA